MFDKEYIIKAGPEFVWAVLIAIVCTVTQIIVFTDPAEVLAEPRTWVISTAVAVGRVAVAAAKNWLTLNVFNKEGTM